mgnify:CR=1 FL=1
MGGRNVVCVAGVHGCVAAGELRSRARWGSVSPWRDIVKQQTHRTLYHQSRSFVPIFFPVKLISLEAFLSISEFFFLETEPAGVLLSLGEI